MTRYSRSVIPGRPDHGRPDNGRQDRGRPDSLADAGSLDRQLFGEKRPQAANEDAPQQQAREAAQRDAAGVGRQDFRLLPDEDGGYRPPPESRRAPILLVGVALTVVVFAAVVVNAYRQGVRPADAEVAPQLASIDSFKTKPAAASGASQPASAQASVFDAIDGGAEGSPAPAAREVRPEPAPVAAAPPPSAQVVTPPVPASVSPTSAGAPISLAPAATAKVDPPKPPTTQAAATQTATTQSVAAKPATVQTTPTERAAPPPLVVPASATPAPAPALVGAYKPPFSAGGAHLVQVAAAGTEAAAMAEWDRRTKSWPDLLQGAERVIVRADVNGRTVYRVRAGAFASAADADEFCAAVKGRGGDCFRTAR